MQITERHVGDVVILDLTGRLILGEPTQLLRDKVNSVVQQNARKVVVNLEHVVYMDSSGIGELARCYTTLTRHGGSLKLLALTKRISDLLTITKLLTVFESYDTEPDALASFGAIGA